MREYAAANKRSDDARAIPRELARWLEAKGMTFEQWSAECRAKQNPEAVALGLRRRRLALAARR